MLQKSSSGSVQAKRQDSFNFDAVSKMVAEINSEKPATASADNSCDEKSRSGKETSRCCEKPAPAKKKKKAEDSDSDVSFGVDDDDAEDVVADGSQNDGRAGRPASSTKSTIPATTTKKTILTKTRTRRMISTVTLMSNFLCYE